MLRLFRDKNTDTSGTACFTLIFIAGFKFPYISNTLLGHQITMLTKPRSIILIETTSIQFK